jgi:DNA replication and repair protein RecF
MSTGALPCRELRLRQFRNFDALDLALPAAGVALIGENGAGKTNLLEAVYYLEIFRSFRGAADAQLVRFGEDTFFVRARFAAEGAPDRVVEAGYSTRGQKKRVAVDGVEPDRLGDGIGNVGAVIFSPSDVELIAGGPGERRRFLDIVLSLAVPGYLPALQRYRSALRQRNALLRQGAADAVIEAWHDGLVEAGAIVTLARAEWIAAQAEAFAARYAAIAGGTTGTMRFRPSIPAFDGGALHADALPDRAHVADAFAGELRRVAARERERGMTIAGPHRDDVLFAMQTADGPVDLREYGSGGQRRTAAIALRLVEAGALRATRGGDPILLLDDVFAELDEARAQRILELIERDERGQVILTAPKESDVRPRAGSLETWRIAAGKVMP